MFLYIWLGYALILLEQVLRRSDLTDLSTECPIKQDINTSTAILQRNWRLDALFDTAHAFIDWCRMILLVHDQSFLQNAGWEGLTQAVR